MTLYERVAYCGLDCNGCPIRWATLEPNLGMQRKMREAIVRLGREHYGMEMEHEDITDCDGCRAEIGKRFSGCRNCAIRECAKGKRISSCAACGEYPCRRLEKFFVSDPTAKMHLEFIRNVT